jgi:uncharacterized protein HemY
MVLISLYAGFDYLNQYDGQVTISFFDYVFETHTVTLIVFIILFSLVFTLVYNFLRSVYNLPQILKTKFFTPNLYKEYNNALETFFLSNLARNDLATGYLKKLTKNTNSNLRGKYLTMLCYLTSRSDEDQIFYLKQLLDNKEAKKFCSFRLMKLYLGLNKFEEALEFADEAKRYDHSNLSLYYYYLVIYKNLRYWNKAVYIIEELERHFKEHITQDMNQQIIQVLKETTKYHLENNEDYEAEHYIKHLLKYIPGDPETIKQLVTIYEGRSKQEGVAEIIKDGYKHKPSKELIELYISLGGVTGEQAIKEFAKITISPESINAIFNFAFENKLEDKLSKLRSEITTGQN